MSMSESATTQSVSIRSFILAKEAEAISDVHRPTIFGETEWSAPVMFGVARLPKNIVDGLWEQHAQGAESLVVTTGNFTFRLQQPDGQISERDAAAFDMVVEPKGSPHSSSVHSEELTILFVTPKAANHDGLEP